MSNKNKEETPEILNSESRLATVDGTQLAKYGGRDVIRELFDRIMYIHPNAEDVGQAGMMAVCQLAVMVGASPLPSTNEIHVWRNGNKIQIQLGINFYRRKALQHGDVFWYARPRKATPEECKQYGIPDEMSVDKWTGPKNNRTKTTVKKKVVGAICCAVRRKDYWDLKKHRLSKDEVFELAGAWGVAICHDGEQKEGRTLLWTAQKRCEVDLYRQLFPLMAEYESTVSSHWVKPIDDEKRVWLVEGNDLELADQIIEKEQVIEKARHQAQEAIKSGDAGGAVAAANQAFYQ